MSEVVKACACGRTYTGPEWDRLTPTQPAVVRYEWGEVHEMRHCACGSTIAIVLAEGEPESGDGEGALGCPAQGAVG